MSRYTIDLNEQFDSTLAKLAQRKGVTKSDVIRRALASYSFLEDAAKQEGKKVSITDEEDKVVKDVVLP